MASTQQLLLGEGAGGAEKVYIEDVFSTYLYTGNNGTQTITNGIDLAGKGGMTWFKNRSSSSGYHSIYDSARGLTKQLITSLSDAEYTTNIGLAYNADGFSFNTSGASFNSSSDLFVSWTFAEKAKFFDVVTYSGNSVSGREIPHNLGSAPGCMIVKVTGNSGSWFVWHRSMGGNNYLQHLNDTDPRVNGGAAFWNNTAPTSTVFTVGNDSDINQTGRTYVAYLFAHDAGGFGTSGSDNVISCGGFTASSGTGTVTLGYEPQWVLLKRTDTFENWYLVDVMRGQPVTTASGKYLIPNNSSAEATGGFIYPTATGFQLDPNAFGSGNNGTYIYIAIRRGPMKVPTDGTEVYNALAYSGSGTDTQRTMGFTPDYFGVLIRNTTQQLGGEINGTRLTASAYRATGSTGADNQLGAVSDYFRWDNMTGMLLKNYQGLNASGYTYVAHSFQRAPSFFDVVILNSSTSTYTHNLTVAPELIFVKCRDASGANWVVYSKSLSSPTTKYLNLNTTGAEQTYGAGAWSTSATQFSVNTGLWANGSSGIAYLFATCAGVSKVGSYTGNGSSQTIACGFTAGSRYVMVKRTDSTGNWYVWDTARGIVSGADPYLLYNSNISEASSDAVDADSSGFIVNQVSDTNINVNGATYIFLAIA